MNFYNTFKRLIGLRSPRMKLIMLAAGKALGMRHIGIFIDPVLACNLRCRMCYFSDPEHVKGLQKGVLSKDQIDSLRKGLMRYALKMQIGCGAEPTLYKDLPYLIRAAKEEKIPYVEITTNGQLLTLEKLSEYIDAGLNGLTLSLHGTTKDTYENLMAGASFEKFLSLLEILKEIKRRHPEFVIRINYTANNLNKAEIATLWELLGSLHIDVLQIRPIQKIGDSSYNDFEISDYARFISDIVEPIGKECNRRGTTAFLPSLSNIERINKSTSPLNALIEEVTYCYVAPGTCYRAGFDPTAETIQHFQRRSGITRRLWQSIFKRNLLTESESVNTSKKLNYK